MKRRRHIRLFYGLLYYSKKSLVENRLFFEFPFLLGIFFMIMEINIEKYMKVRPDEQGRPERSWKEYESIF